MKSLRLRSPAIAALLLTATLHSQVAPPPLTPPAVSPRPVAIPPPSAPDSNALKWDADVKEVNARPGELSAPFSFVVTNVSDHEVTINALRTSCGCTVAQLPTTPYKLEPGSNVSIAVTLDLRGKSGTLAKTVTVASSAEIKSLIVRANIPQATPGVPVAYPAAPVSVASSPVAVPGSPERLPGVPIAMPRVPIVVPIANATGDRAMNIQNALADRQAVFKGDCATCHVDKGTGRAFGFKGTSGN